MLRRSPRCRRRAPNLAALVQGSCIAADDPGDIVRAVSSDCAKPHALELFASYTLPGALSEPFPGDDELQAQGNALCSGGAFDELRRTAREPLAVRRQRTGADARGVGGRLSKGALLPERSPREVDG